MNGYTLTLYALLAAFCAQAFAAAPGIRCCLRRDLPPARRQAGLALAGGSLLLALHHAHTLELAWRAGLYDLRQALLAAAAAICFALGAYAFGEG